MKRSIPILLLLALGMGACKKKEDAGPATPPSSSTSARVEAGVHDSTFVFQWFFPVLDVPVVWDAQNLYGFGTDSMDLDTNGTFDLIIQLSLLNPDSVHLLQGTFPNPFPNCRLFVRNGLEIAVQDSYYSIGQGQSGVVRSADTLAFGERVDQVSKWYSENAAGMPMWQETPGGAFTPPNGLWYSTSSLTYLGFRMPGGVHGWIEVDNSDRRFPMFTRFAFK